MRTWPTLALSAAILTGATGLMLQPAASVTGAAAVSKAPSTDWPAYEHGPAHSSANVVDAAITTANADSLQERWHFLVADRTHAGQPRRRIDASPTVAAGRVYIGSRTGMFYVLNAATGAVIWTKQLDYGLNTYCPANGIVASATVQPDPVTGALTVYVSGAHYLYALNAATGAELWKTSIGPDTKAGNGLYFDWSSPTVLGGHIFVGLAANCEAHLIRGGVVSVDQHTGALQHTYYAVPPGKVGASVWSSQAAVGASVFATTGNPDPTGTTIDDSYSVVRLSASTLARQDKWTVPAGQSADLDFGSSPTLFPATVDGAMTNLIAACNKNGIMYAWRRDDLAAGPVWSRRVGASDSSESGACLTSPAWDTQLHRLFVASNETTIAGADVPGGLRALDPATGAVLWAKPLPCLPVGSPTVNGAVVAVPMLRCPTGITPTVELFDEATGAHLASVPATGNTFAQPVFAEGGLFVASEDGTLTAYGP